MPNKCIFWPTFSKNDISDSLFKKVTKKHLYHPPPYLNNPPSDLHHTSPRESQPLNPPRNPSLVEPSESSTTLPPRTNPLTHRNRWRWGCCSRAGGCGGSGQEAGGSGCFGDFLVKTARLPFKTSSVISGQCSFLFLNFTIFFQISRRLLCLPKTISIV